MGLLNLDGPALYFSNAQLEIHTTAIVRTFRNFRCGKKETDERMMCNFAGESAMGVKAR